MTTSIIFIIIINLKHKFNAINKRIDELKNINTLLK